MILNTNRCVWERKKDEEKRSCLSAREKKKHGKREEGNSHIRTNSPTVS
jgi:hypothetical protein